MAVLQLSQQLHQTLQPPLLPGQLLIQDLVLSVLSVLSVGRGRTGRPAAVPGTQPGPAPTAGSEGQGGRLLLLRLQAGQLPQEPQGPVPAGVAQEPQQDVPTGGAAGRRDTVTPGFWDTAVQGGEDKDYRRWDTFRLQKQKRVKTTGRTSWRAWRRDSGGPSPGTQT